MWSKIVLAVALLATNLTLTLAHAAEPWSPKCRKVDRNGPPYITTTTTTTTAITTITTTTTTTTASQPTCTGVSPSPCNSNTRLTRSLYDYTIIKTGCQIQNSGFEVKRVLVYDNTTPDCDAISKCADYANANDRTAFRTYFGREDSAWLCQIGDKTPANVATESDETVDRWYYYEGTPVGNAAR